MRSKAHPSNPRYYPWEVFDAPDRRLHGLLFRGTDLQNSPPTFFPNGTVFQNRRNGTLVLVEGRSDGVGLLEREKLPKLPGGLSASRPSE